MGCRDFTALPAGAFGEGALQAIQEAGFKPGEVFIWGTGGSKVGFKHVQEGWFTSTTSVRPSQDATLSVETIDKLLRGEKTEFFNYLPNIIVTKENVAQFLPGEW